MVTIFLNRTILFDLKKSKREPTQKHHGEVWLNLDQWFTQTNVDDQRNSDSQNKRSLLRNPYSGDLYPIPTCHS